MDQPTVDFLLLITCTAHVMGYQRNRIGEVSQRKVRSAYAPLVAVRSLPRFLCRSVTTS